MKNLLTSTIQLKILEQEFLTFVRFELYVSKEIYDGYLMSFEQFRAILQMQEEYEAMACSQQNQNEEGHRTDSQNEIKPEVESKNIENVAFQSIRNEEVKNETEFREVSMRNEEYTDEDMECQDPIYYDKDVPNPASPHSKLLNLSRRSSISDYDDRSLSSYYCDSGRNNSDIEDDVVGFVFIFLTNSYD